MRKLYRISIPNRREFQWRTSLREAKRAARAYEGTVEAFEAEYIPRWVVAWGMPGYLYDNQTAYPNKRTAMRAAADEARMDREAGRRVTGNARDGYDVAWGEWGSGARIDLYPVLEGSQGDWLDASELWPVVKQPAKTEAA